MEEEPEGWEEVTLYLKAIVDSEFFLGKDKCLPFLEHVKTAAEAIDFALCFERETLLYYYTLREALKGKRGSRFYYQGREKPYRMAHQFEEKFCVASNLFVCYSRIPP